VRSKSDTITVVKTGKFKEDNKVYEEFQMHIKWGGLESLAF